MMELLPVNGIDFSIFKVSDVELEVSIDIGTDSDILLFFLVEYCFCYVYKILTKNSI